MVPTYREYFSAVSNTSQTLPTGGTATVLLPGGVILAQSEVGSWSQASGVVTIPAPGTYRLMGQITAGFTSNRDMAAQLFIEWDDGGGYTSVANAAYQAPNLSTSNGRAQVGTEIVVTFTTAGTFRLRATWTGVTSLGVVNILQARAYAIRLPYAIAGGVARTGTGATYLMNGSTVYPDCTSSGMIYTNGTTWTETPGVTFASGVATITQGGIWLVRYFYQMNNIGNTVLSNPSTWIEANTGGGYSQLLGSGSACYMNNSGSLGGGYDACFQPSWFAALTAGTLLRPALLLPSLGVNGQTSVLGAQFYRLADA